MYRICTGTGRPSRERGNSSGTAAGNPPVGEVVGVNPPPGPTVRSCAPWGCNGCAARASADGSRTTIRIAARSLAATETWRALDRGEAAGLDGERWLDGRCFTDSLHSARRLTYVPSAQPTQTTARLGNASGRIWQIAAGADHLVGCRQARTIANARVRQDTSRTRCLARGDSGPRAEPQSAVTAHASHRWRWRSRQPSR